jgi:radical SAM protein with 4Fe4S-binding SPASM domain
MHARATNQKIKKNMKAQEYRDWSLGVHQRLATKRIPISGSIEITQRCNHKCIHCYNNLAAGDRRARAKELSFEEHCRILDEITETGCLWLLFTGGEIFVRKDFLDIYKYARQKGLLVTLFTNGTLISPEIADLLAQFPPFAIEITVYGYTQDTYESITRTPGSYGRCTNGIELLTKRKLPLKLKTMALTRNKLEIDALKRFVEEDLGLEFKFDAMVNPRRDCTQIPLDVRLAPVEVVKLDLRYHDRIDEWKRFAESFSNAAIDPDRAGDLYVCGAGNSSFAIDPCGRLSPCVLSATDSYDLRRGNFREGWGMHLAAVRKKKASRLTKCSTCRLKSMCGMCPANSELECADPEAPVDFLCQVAHLRAYVLDLPIATHGACEYCPGGSRYAEMKEKVSDLKGLRAED